MKINNKDVPLIRLLKIVSQMVFFIVLPGLYVSAFSGIKQLYTSILHQNFSTSAMLPQIVEVIAIVPVTILVGRFFCGWMCAFGAMGDLLHSLSSKLIKRRFKLSEKADQVLKYTKYAVLLFLVIAVWSFDVPLFSSFSPWDAFGMLFTVGKLPDFPYVLSNLLPGFILLIFIIIGSLFIERFFCRYLCPLGAVFALVSKLRITSILKSREKCGKCRICTNNCPMGIPLYQTDTVKTGECIECFHCVTACPRHNVSLAVTDKDVRPVLAGTAAVASIAGLYYAGTLANSVLKTNVPTAQTDTSVSSNKIYNDGTYTGEGNGFRGTTSISVTVQNDKITDIKVLSTRDDRQFFDRASSGVIQSVIKKQSTAVDTVSGATYSSLGILKAVENALSKAKILSGSNTTAFIGVTSETIETSAFIQSNDVPETVSDINTNTEQNTSSSSAQASLPLTNFNSNSSSSETSSKNASASSAVSSNQSTISSSPSKTTTTPVKTDVTTTATTASSKYKDGTYEGSGRGYRGTTTVSVTVKNGVIKDVTIISFKDDSSFFNYASPTIIQSVIKQQSADVDTVSGATYSSRGILQAVANALSKAS